jgi:hypothetical protein
MGLAGLPPAAKTAVVGICLYEAAAITSRRVPTVSMLCRHHRWAEAVLLAVLLAHLHTRLAGSGLSPDAVQEAVNDDQPH